MFFLVKSDHFSTKLNVVIWSNLHRLIREIINPATQACFVAKIRSWQSKEFRAILNIFKNLTEIIENYVLTML